MGRPRRRKTLGPLPGTPEHRELVRAGMAERKERLRARPRDLERLRREGMISLPLAPLVEQAEAESEELVSQLGGYDEVTPARRLLIADAAYLGIALKAEMGRFIATADSVALERVATLANSRRSNLVAVGLDRAARQVPSLEDYLARKAAEDATGAMNGEG